MPPATSDWSPRADRCPTGRTSPTIEPGCSRAIGVASVDDLFEDIPAAPAREPAAHRPRGARARAEPAGSPALAARNRVDLASFLGAGAYRHWTPPAVDQLLLRGEWYTAYTPYQPEVSQGTLQSIYEYQSLLAELTGLDVVSASPLRRRRGHRRGRADDLPGHAPRTAPRLARRPPALPPDAATYADGAGLVVDEVPLVAGGPGRRARPTSRRSSACSPIPTGPSRASSRPSRRHPRPARGHAGHRARSPTPPGALFVSVIEPVSLAVLAPPGEYGADIAAGEGQPLGIPLQYGGPYLGIVACTDALVRQIPGRLVGLTTDLDGRRAFVMTLRAREQDIRREKAASNICTNQALLALAASIYLATVGPPRAARRRGAGCGAGHRPRVRPRGRRRAAAPRAPRTSTSSSSASPTRRPSTPGCSIAACSRASRRPRCCPTSRRSPTGCSCARPR